MKPGTFIQSHGPVMAAALGVLITASSLFTGLVADDLLHRRVIEGALSGASPAPWWDLYTFIPNSPEAVKTMRAQGGLPWWTWSGTHLAFFRPFSALTQYIDYLLWPGSPEAMHAHSLLWYGILCYLVALLYRGIQGGRSMALLAAVIFAVDPSHASSAGWIASRNVLLAAVFGVLALLAHHRWRQSGQKAWLILSPTAFALSLLSAELGISTFFFVAAYAAALDQRSLPSRALSLLPSLAVGVAWFWLYRGLGYGAGGSMLYADPLEDLAGFVAHIPLRLKMLLSMQFVPPLPAELGLIAFPAVALRWSLTAITGVTLLGYAVLGLRRDRVVRFLVLCWLLSFIPLMSSAPHPRVLVFSGIPLALLLARVMVGLYRQQRRVPMLLLLAPLCLGLLVLSPLTLALFAGPPISRAEHTLRQQLAPVGSIPLLQKKQLILVNAPDIYAGLLLSVKLHAAGLPTPGMLFVWSSTDRHMDVTRPQEHVLELSSPHWFEGDLLALNYRDRAHPLRKGQWIQLHTHRVRVLELMPDGRPRRVQFRFPFTLDGDPLLHMLSWNGRRYVRFLLPEIGETVRITVQWAGLSGE